MGLDHWLEGRLRTDTESLPIRFGQPWRKWYALQEYIMLIWIERTGSNEEFNCIPFELSEEDLNGLEKWILENQDAAYEDDDEDEKEEFREQNREIIEEARSFMEENSEAVICYNSWW